MRGQAHTLEAVVAGLLLLSSLLFALQITAVTPLSASTSSQHVENQQGSMASGVLSAAAENDSLKPAVLYWSDSDGKFHSDTGPRGYNNEPPDNGFGRMLERNLDDEGIIYNVYFTFQKPSGGLAEYPYIYRGTPSDNAVRASRTVTIHDHDELVNEDESTSSMNVSESSTFFIDNQDNGSPVYNVVRVEVVAWRI